ncbi:MAG: SUMF1/EgtB/PvdO family nonheme iron enzyme [Gammaproteobacteria bacterium]|nr:SUMF1/EgtB/PvdO family nonheme iron enzyme [Gammaproteobacteria bacterium]
MKKSTGKSNPAADDILTGFIDLLYRTGLKRKAWEIADSLWLAGEIAQRTGQQPSAAQSALPEKAEEDKSAYSASSAPPLPGKKPLPSVPLVIPAPPDKREKSALPPPEADRAPAPTGRRPVRAPASAMLPGALALARSLRPLNRRVPSRIHKIVDEAATVHNLAELQIPLPILRGAPERWLELALVIDSHDSMHIWHPLIIELRHLLERQGAFRDVRVWRLDWHDPRRTNEKRPCLRAGLHGESGAKAWQNLLDPLGNRVILIVSDYVSPAWSEGVYNPVLSRLSRRQPAALLHLLPQRLWRRTAFAAGKRIQLQGTTQPAAPSKSLRIVRQAPVDGIKLPIVTLSPDSVRAWSNLLSAKGCDLQSGIILPGHPVETGKPAEPDAQTRVLRFIAGASPQAQALARYCAPLPITLPVARLVQETFQPDSHPTELAELFLGDLLKKAAYQTAPNPGPLETIYEFHTGVQALLLGQFKPLRLWETLKRLSVKIEACLGRPHDFPAWFADPTIASEHILDRENRPFAHIRIEVLKRLGGVYGEWAVRLQAALEGDNNADAMEEEASFIEPFHDFLSDRTPGPAMVFLAGGSFIMGDDKSDRDNEKPVHPVTLSEFSVGRYPVTFEEYDRFCEAVKREKPEDEGWGRGKRPVINVSWHDAVAYCEWLSEQTKQEYRLLTEAEWEYACRAGSETAYCFGDDENQLAEYAWYDEELKGKTTHPVGKKKPNRFGLYDVHGNVLEWVQDWHGEYPKDAQTDPSGPDTGSLRGRRGGSWGDLAGYCRSAFRVDWGGPDNHDYDLGFRLARTHPLPSDDFTLLPELDEAPDTQVDKKSPYNPYQVFTDDLKDSEKGPEMVYLPGGVFRMGDENISEREKPVHEVTLEHFAIGKYPVTVGEYLRFAEAVGKHYPEWMEERSKYNYGPDYKKFGESLTDERCPIIGISWNDAVAYCNWLSRQSGEEYVLPTEAEWEYACRAGSKTAYFFGDGKKRLDDYAWYSANSEGKMRPVGEKKANAWGLYDISGNVWEWVYDKYDKYSREAQTNPRGPELGSGRGARGGSWYDDAKRCRSADRGVRRHAPDNRERHLGFRLARRTSKNVTVHPPTLYSLIGHFNNNEPGRVR